MVWFVVRQYPMNALRATQSAKARYIELLKSALACRLYPEPPVPIELLWCKRGWFKRSLARVLAPAFGMMGAKLCIEPNYTQEQLDSGTVWRLLAVSLISPRRMDNLCFCVETVLAERIPGDLIETGVWRGGACIVMKGLLAINAITDRKVFVADSFQGLPPPDAQKYPADAGDTHHKVPYLAVSRARVEDNFRRFGLLDEQVVFLEGWFKDTLPKLRSRQLALMRLDGDMYESTMDALTHLYPKLSAGGFCIIDDYDIRNCRMAVDDFRKSREVTDPLVDIDGHGCYWRKGVAL